MGFKTLVFIGTILVSLRSFSGDVLSFSEAKMAKALESFLGTYKAISDKNGEELLISVNFLGNKLEIVHLPEYSNLIYTKEIDLTRVDHVEVTTGVNMGHVTQRTLLQISGNKIERVIIEENFSQKMVEVDSLELVGDEIRQIFRRTYYKRKFGLVGPWVRDKTSYNATKGTFDRVYHAGKVSPRGIPRNKLQEMAYNREYYTAHLVNPGTGRALQANSDSNFVLSPAFKPRFNNIVPFHAGQCRQLFR